MSTKSCDQRSARVRSESVAMLDGSDQFALALGMECPDLTLLPRSQPNSSVRERPHMSVSPAVTFAALGLRSELLKS